MPVAKNSQPRPVPPEVTLMRMKNIVTAEFKYGIRGVASVDILAPHCAVALFTLTRGAVTVVINGESSRRKYAVTLAEGHRDFAEMRGELRERGPVKLRHIND